MLCQNLRRNVVNILSYFDNSLQAVILSSFDILKLIMN